MADQSREGSQTDCRSLSKGHETFYIQVYQRDGSQRESSSIGKSIQDQNLNEHSSFEKQGFPNTQETNNEAVDISKTIVTQVVEETMVDH